MFGLFSRNKEVDLVYSAIMQFITMLSRSAERLGDQMVFRLVRSPELVSEAHEERTSGREGYRFHLSAPLSDFWGTVAVDIDGSLGFTIEGFGRFQCFMLVGKLPIDRLSVSAKDGIRARKTKQADSLKSKFVDAGASDFGEWL